MDSLYKKKNLKFSGFHKEITKGEIKVTREASRQKRLSTLRDLNFKDSKENISELHKLISVEKKSGIPSRNEMLKKWKEEKAMKMQKKESIIKSVVKPGFCFKNQISRTTKNENKTEGLKLNAQNLSSVAQRTQSQNTKATSAVLKSASQSAKSLCIPKKNTVPVTNSVTNVKSQAIQRPVASKSVLNLKAPTKKIGPSSSLPTNVPQRKAIAKEFKPIVQNPKQIYPKSSKVAPVTNTRTASRNTIHQPKVSQNIPLVKLKEEKDIKSTNLSTVNKLSKIALPKHSNSSSNRFGNKKNQMPKEHFAKTVMKKSQAKTGEIFTCDISRIEPTVNRKSFAPQNFLFCPPAEWSFPFQIEVSSPPFSKLRSNGVQRTSSPLKCEESNESSTNELPTVGIKQGVTPNYILQKEISFNEKIKSFPEDNVCQKSLSDAKSQNINMEAVISELKTENKCIISSENFNNSLSDFTADLSQKIPVIASDDIHIEGNGHLSNKKVTNPQGVLSPLLNVQSTLPEVLDSTAQIASKKCGASLNKTIEEAKMLESAKCASSKALATTVVIDSASQNLAHTLVPIDNYSQNAIENYSNLCVPSSSEFPVQDVFQDTEICASFDVPKENKLVNIDSVDIIFSYKSVDNSDRANNKDKSTMPLCNNIDCPDLCVFSSDQKVDDQPGDGFQNKILETMNPKVLGEKKQIKTVDALFLCNVPENSCYEVENNLDQCPNSLRESLESFNLATSVSEKVSEKVSMRHRKLNMSQKFALERINESIESRGTPCVTPKSLKKLIAEETFTPRRSARLSEKLNRSGSFESILNTEKPKVKNSLDLDDIKIEASKRLANKNNATPVSCKKKQVKNKDFTPRRSERLSAMSRRSSSYENLFEVRRPSVMGSPSTGDFLLGDAAEITYDFDNLALEDSSKVIETVKGHTAKASKKVSLLYTPPARKSIMRQSIRGDLMSFSPS